MNSLNECKAKITMQGGSHWRLEAKRFPPLSSRNTALAIFGSFVSFTYVMYRSELSAK